MLINKQQIKRRVTRHSHVPYISYVSRVNNVQYSLLNDDFLNIVNNNNLSNIQKIITEKLELGSVTNIYKLIDYTNLLKLDLEKKIKSNKNNEIYLGLCSLLILVFCIIYVYILLHLTTIKLIHKIFTIVILLLINIKLIGVINDSYPPTFIQKKQLEKFHATTKILNKILEATF